LTDQNRERHGQIDTELDRWIDLSQNPQVISYGRPRIMNTQRAYKPRFQEKKANRAERKDTDDRRDGCKTERKWQRKCQRDLHCWEE
jgi:hypothetical protein